MPTIKDSPFLTHSTAGKSVRFMAPLLTTEQIAPLFHVSRKTITLWALRGWIRGFRQGKRWYFTQDAVNALIEVR